MHLKEFIENIPKAELHLHIEGTFEPELMFAIARRNGIELKYKSVEELKNAYNFSNLQDFLNIYYEGAGCLNKEQDFYDLTWAYLEKANSQNIVHTEIFFDPQTHTDRGVPFAMVISGIHRALEDAEDKFGITSRIIMCFLRDLSLVSAMETLEEALFYKDWIVGVGLDSAEIGNPPSKFNEVFERALGEGFLTVCHAGEEGPAEYVWEAIDLLRISRIDHGNRSLDDEKLVSELVSSKIPLTVCPLSNYKLRVVDELKNHPLKKMLALGLFVTVNSDDPAYFGGYVNENYLALVDAIGLDKNDVITLAKNSFIASFLPDRKKEELIKKVDEFVDKG